MSDIKSSYSIQDGLFIRKDTQDVSNIIRDNANERNSGENDKRGMHGRKFASIPLVVAEDLKQRLGIDVMLFGKDPEHTARLTLWLQDPANRAWRTSEAKLGNGHQFVQ